jgi:two-component system, response regulator YesN
MHKILVVDDEPMVCTGIRNFLLQSPLDITHVETARNGFEALDYLRMEPFDLIITDIQMNKMDGIELMEAIFLEQPWLPVVVISAHEKFDFAKKSLRLGAKDYLIKPVELDELIRVVGRALGEKQQAGKQTLQNSMGKDSRSEGLFKRRNEALMELVTEKSLQHKDYVDLMGTIGLPFIELEFYYGIAMVELDVSKGGFSDREMTLTDRKLLKYASINILEESLADWKGMVFPGFGNHLIALILLDKQEESNATYSPNRQLNLIGQMIHRNIKEYLNVDAAAGLSTIHADIWMLPKLLEEAQIALEWRRMHSNQKVFYYEDMVGIGEVRAEASGSSTENNKLEQLAPDREQVVINHIMEYIQSKYGDRGLKIQDIADHVHFSPAYVSYLFKKKVKTNIWDYVSQVRIGEAKRLLTATDMKRYEIAYQVGYESPEHFSRMFKRYVGISPADYRKEDQGESN